MAANRRSPALVLVALVVGACTSLPLTPTPTPPASSVASNLPSAGRSATPTPISENVATAAAIEHAGSSIPVTVLSATLSTYGAESQNSSIVDATTPVWAVRLSGSFYPASCGPMTATPHPCPSPAPTALVLIDARTGAFIQAEMPAPAPS